MGLLLTAGFMVCGARQNFYMFSLYFNPDVYDLIYDFLLSSMAAMQAGDARASFLFPFELIGHHREWLGSTTKNHHGVASIKVETVSGFDQLMVETRRLKPAEWQDVICQLISFVCTTGIVLDSINNTGVLLARSIRLIFCELMTATGLTWKILSTVNWELI